MKTFVIRSIFGKYTLKEGQRVRVVRRGRFAGPNSRLKEGTGKILRIIAPNEELDGSDVLKYYGPLKQENLRYVASWLKCREARLVVLKGKDHFLVVPAPAGYCLVPMQPSVRGVQDFRLTDKTKSKHG